MKPVLRPRCELPAWFGLSVDGRAVFFPRTQEGAGGGEGRKEGKVLGWSGLCFSENIERGGLSQGWLCPLESLLISAKDFYF